MRFRKAEFIVFKYKSVLFDYLNIFAAPNHFATLDYFGRSPRSEEERPVKREVEDFVIVEDFKKLARFVDKLKHSLVEFLKFIDEKLARVLVLDSGPDLVEVDAHNANRVKNQNVDKHHVLAQNGEPIISFATRVVAMDRPNTIRVFGSFRFYCSEGIRWLRLAKRVVENATKKKPTNTPSGGRRIMEIGRKGLLLTLHNFPWRSSQ